MTERFSHIMEFGRWQDHGSCANMYRTDSWEVIDKVFFGEMGRPRNFQASADICEFCPVRMLCLEDSIVHLPLFGVWGGLTVGQRDMLLSANPKLRMALLEAAILDGWVDVSQLKPDLRRYVQKRRAQLQLEKEAAHLVDTPEEAAPLDFGTVRTFAAYMESSS